MPQVIIYYGGEARRMYVGTMGFLGTRRARPVLVPLLIEAALIPGDS